MKHNKAIFYIAMSIALNNDYTRDVLNKTNDLNKALAGTSLKTFNYGESPMYFPTRSQKIKSKKRRN